MNLDLFKPPKEIKEFLLLQELEKNPVVSQRELSQKFGISLGMTNACLRKMVQSGWIRTGGTNHRKTGYYLTPKGVSEKTRLTLLLVSVSVQHYSMLKSLIREKLLDMQRVGMKRIVFYGVSEEMEVAFLTLRGLGLRLVGIIEDEKNMTGEKILGFQLKPVSQVGYLQPDAIFITSLSETDEKMRTLGSYVGASRKKIVSLAEKEGNV